MDQKTIALDAINEAINRISEHFNGDIDPTLITISSAHIKLLQQHLFEMKNSIDTDNFMQGQSLFGIGRVVVDSWPFDSVVGNSIIKADQCYRNYMMLHISR